MLLSPLSNSFFAVAAALFAPTAYVSLSFVVVVVEMGFVGVVEVYICRKMHIGTSL